MTTSGEDPSSPDPRQNEAFWREYLEKPDSLMGFARPLFSRIPSDPRCQMCGSPFHGFGGQLMKVIGKNQSTANPRMCTTCEKVMLRHHGGATVPGTMLFADIRGSTTLGERMSPAEFHAVLDRYYTTASKTVFAHNGMVDKFVGDELVAVFPPVLGDNHARRAIDAALALLRATGHDDPGGPWAPIGAGIHTGDVWFGAVGEGDHVELTVVGDPVNTTARLAAAAGPGELLVSVEAATAAELDGSLERRSLELKGKEAPTEVISLRVDGRVMAQSADS